MSARWIRDRLEVLQHLYAVALATAALTILFKVGTEKAGVGLPSWLDPAIGFIVAVPVSAIGYLVATDLRRQQLRDVVQAVVNILDWDLQVGWDAAMPSHRPLSIRDLARAGRSGDLEDVLRYEATGGYQLSRRVEEYVGEFERRTASAAGMLVPPRANSRVAAVIRQLRQFGYASAAYERGESDLAALVPYLTEGVDAAEELEVMFDRKEAQRAAAAREADAAKRSARRIELQAIAGRASQQLLVDAAPPHLERSSFDRADVDLRTVAAAPGFAYHPAAETEELTAWRGGSPPPAMPFSWL